MNACAAITNKVEDSNCLHCTLKTKIIGSFIGLIAGFVIVVILETAFITRPPIIIGHEQVVAFNRNIDLVIDYRRNLGAYHEFYAIRSVRVSCNGISYSIPDNIHYYQEEPPHESRTFYVLPSFMQPEGTHCVLHRTLIWKPDFSLSNKTYSLPKIEFVIGEFKALE
ncbi:hypothetical protein CCP4SC76_2580020 [Gammaproteobacteria bacterium]